ncbi:MAG: hypothetical protein AB7K52_10600 [Phycisphaerales bacterium]
MTMIEVVLASLLLAMLASALCGAIVYAHRAEMLRVKRLMAYDVANRLLLQYIDDTHNKNFPKPNDPVMHEGRPFYFELIEEPLQMENLDGYVPPQAASMRLIRIRVFDAFEPYPGNVQKSVQLAELVRPFHPLVAMYRNADSQGRNLSNMEFVTDLLKLAPGASGGGTR